MIDAKTARAKLDGTDDRVYEHKRLLEDFDTIIMEACDRGRNKISVDVDLRDTDYIVNELRKVGFEVYTYKSNLFYGYIVTVYW